MKRILFIILLLPLLTSASTFYVDESAGGSNGGTFANPWQSIADINWASVSAGDFIRFKRGVTFTGTLTIPKSGSAGNPITLCTYGSGAKPKFTGNGATTIQYLFYFFNKNYITFDSLWITDPTLNSDVTRDALSHIQRAITFDGTSNNNKVLHCDFSLVGVCVYCPTGPNNTIDGCDMGNLRMIVNDIVNVGFGNDYGANGIIIEDCDNITIINNNIHDTWATSFDYGYDGGAVEFFGNGGGHIIRGNIMSQNIGISEVTGDTHNVDWQYNIIVNNGAFVNFHAGHTNTTWTATNNVFVLTEVSKVGDSRLFDGTFAGSSQLTLTNNVFYMRAGCDVAASGTGISEDHCYYNLGSGSTVGFTIDGTSISNNSTTLWANMTGNAETWDYRPNDGTTLSFGTNVSLTPDYYGNIVSTPFFMGVGQFSSFVAPVTQSAITIFGRITN